MEKTPDIMVLGDINLDFAVAGNLPFAFPEVTQNVTHWHPLQLLPGGSGLLFAQFAREAGYRPFLLGRVGDDWAGSFLTSWLGEQGIVSGVTRDPTRSTGLIFLARDSKDNRLQFNNPQNANGGLTVEDVDARTEAITRCRILYLSGYCLRDPGSPQTRAAVHALELGRRAGCRIVVDVVPHQIYKTYPFDRFRELTGPVDILISEAATVRRFLGLGHREEDVMREVVTDTVHRLQPYYRGFVLRYGPSGCDRQVFWDAATNRLEYDDDTGHAAATDKRGLGDRLTIRALRSFFGLEPSS